MFAFFARWLRIARRSLLFSAVISYFALEYALRPSNRKNALSKAVWLHRTCAATARVLNFRTQLQGTPPHGRLLISNHVSYVDIIIMSAAMPVVFVAKSEVRGWPIFGWFARLAGTRFIDRRKRSDVARVADDIMPALEEGVSVVIYLEGTSSDGSKVLPFKTSLLEPAVRDKLPVIPAAIGYTVPPGHSAAMEVCWWGDMTLPPHLVNLFGLEYVNAYLSWGEPVAPTEDRKELAQTLHAKASELHRNLACFSGGSARP